MDHDAAFALNRANWDERVAVHMGPRGYNLSGLRAGRGRLNALEEAELPELVGDLAGLRVIHLQCHFGADTLALAQRGAEVVGVDFSPAAISADFALELELAGTAPASWSATFTTLLRRWAKPVRSTWSISRGGPSAGCRTSAAGRVSCGTSSKPGGRLYFLRQPSGRAGVRRRSATRRGGVRREAGLVCPLLRHRPPDAR